MSLTERIDSFFSRRTPTEQLLIIAAIFIVILAISFEYIAPLSESFMKKNKAQKEEIEAKIKDDRSYLKVMTVNGDPEYYVKLYRSEIEKAKQQYLAIQDKYNYLVYKIKELSYLLYNKKRWAQFLDSITKKANANGVDIDYISNTFFDTTNEFGHVLEIEVGCNGEFRDLIGFLNDIEQSDLVVDVYALEMEGANPTQLQFKVSVWGISL
ncbi:MAG: hypothetical protein GXO16_02110 [Epsilonproteobacteria bacterium]|nr:hypothetical protein [Campylobacterota bacterium]